MKIKLLFLLTIFFVCNTLICKETILIIHSYEKDYDWVKEITNGITAYSSGKSFFDIKPYKLQNVEFQSFYMDAKIHQKDLGYLRDKGNELVAIIKKVKPKIVLISDDEALEYVAKELVCKTDTKFVFFGVNKSLNDYNIIKNYKNPECNITGLVSEIPFKYSIKLASKIVNKLQGIYVFFDDSNSGKGILANFKEQVGKLEEKDLQNKIKSILVSNDFELWKSEILKVQKSNNLLIFGTHYTLHDNQNSHLTSKDVAKWVFNNSKVPDLVVTTTDVSNGFLLSISNPGFVHGYFAMDYTAKLMRGVPIKDLPVITPNQKAVHINLKRAKKLKLVIPIDILALADSFNYLGY